MKEDRLLSASKAAKVLGLSRVTVWKYAKDGLFPVYQLPGGHFRVKESDLNAFIEAHKVITPGVLEEYHQRIGFVEGVGFTEETEEGDKSVKNAQNH